MQTFKTMTYKEAIAEAKAISKEEGCVQHVNFIASKNTWYVDDWYNCDSTDCSFVNGERVS